MIEAGLYNLLRTTAEVAEIVGPRIFPVRVPQDEEAPCIVYALSSTEFGDGLDDDGDTAEQTGPETARFRLECWADSADGYKVACRLAGAVVSLLRTHKGAMGSGSSIKCKHVAIEDVRDEETQLADADDYRRFLRVVDIAIEYDPEQV